MRAPDYKDKNTMVLMAYDPDANAYHPVDVNASGQLEIALLAGEDQTNNVLVIDTGQYGYETIAPSQTAQVLGTTGAAGDFLHQLIVVVETAATGQVTINDGGGSEITVFPNSPGNGVGVYEVTFNMVSQTGAWAVTTLAGASAIAVGRFT